MASSEVEIYKGVRRFSDFLKDSVVNSVVSKMQTMNHDFSGGDMNEVVQMIEATFEQCNMSGFREVESCVRSALKNNTGRKK